MKRLMAGHQARAGLIDPKRMSLFRPHAEDRLLIRLDRFMSGAEFALGVVAEAVN